MILLSKKIDVDELYPIYTVKEADAYGTSVMIPEDVVKRYERTKKAFIKSQDELEKIYEAAGGDFSDTDEG